MNCLGVDRTKQMVDAILKMEKAAIAAPELARHIVYMANTTHQAYHTAADEKDKSWLDCLRPFCSTSKDIITLCCPEVLS